MTGPARDDLFASRTLRPVCPTSLSTVRLGHATTAKTLRDAKGVNVAAMDEPWTSGGRRDVSRINSSGEATSLVFSFDTTFFLVCTDVRCEFVDLVTKQRHELTGSGSVGSWSMVFRCDGHVIATFEKDVALSDKYFLHIAAGVDLALIVSLVRWRARGIRDNIFVIITFVDAFNKTLYRLLQQISDSLHFPLSDSFPYPCGRSTTPSMIYRHPT